MKYDVTIGVPFYNVQDYLRRALDSALLQDYPSIEFLIVDDCSNDDTIRLLPYIDYDVIKNNPKVFMGYSDATVNHLMMNKAGLVSFYGPTIMCEFGEYVKMFDYTKQAIENVLFNDCENYEIIKKELFIIFI